MLCKRLVGCRFLAEVEMRLHLTAEDIETSLQEQSRDALYRIPAAVQEISHVKVDMRISSCQRVTLHPNVVLCLQNDLLSLKQGVHKQLQQLNLNAAAATNSVALLKQVDKVKDRMEAACSTLKVTNDCRNKCQKPHQSLSNCMCVHVCENAVYFIHKTHHSKGMGSVLC